MIVKLEFDTEKDEENNLHKTYIKAEDMVLALWDIKQELRTLKKYAELKENQYEIVEDISEKFYDILHEYGLQNIIE